MRRVGSALVLAVIAVSCTTSRVGRTATIELDGRVERRGNIAVAGAPLALLREGDAGDVLLAVATVGFACLGGKEAPAICHNARYTSTDASGAFEYTLKGSDTQSSFGFSAVLSLTTKLPPNTEEVTGPSTTYRFHVQTAKLDLPIRMWEPVLAARTGSFGARATFPAVPAGLLPSSLSRGIGYTIEFSRDDDVVWEVTGARSTTTFDPRLLEDSIGTMRIIASASSRHVSVLYGDEVAFAMRSGARAYESPLGPPPSRGKACSIQDVRGKLYAVSPCRLTDGDFSRAFAPSVCSGGERCTEPRHESAVVDLGRAAPVDLIVVRGCSGSCRVETSTDLTMWRFVGSTDATRAAFPIVAAPRARYVRVSSPFVDALTEVSAWAGRPSVPNESLLVAPGTFPVTNRGATPAISSKRARGSPWWSVLAAALIGAVGGAAAMLLARRRNT